MSQEELIRNTTNKQMQKEQNTVFEKCNITFCALQSWYCLKHLACSWYLLMLTTRRSYCAHVKHSFLSVSLLDDSFI